MSKITLTTNRTAAQDSDGPVGLICEAAPDGGTEHRSASIHNFAEIFGDRQLARQRSRRLAHTLVIDEPRLRGVQQLRVFEEVLIGELEPIFLLLNLAEWLRAHRFTSCAIEGGSWIAPYRSVLAKAGNVSLEVSGDASAQLAGRQSIVSATRRALARLRSARFSGSSLRSEWRQFMDRIDPYHRRAAALPQAGKYPRGDVWFYSTATTFTNIGLGYEPFIGMPFRFLVENPLRGGAPLRGIGRSFSSVHEFSSTRFIPSRQEIEEGARAVREHLGNLAVDQVEAQAREALLDGPFLNDFFERLLPLGLYHASLFEEWTERTQPAALVVGNFIFEAFALLACRRRGIPTILLQHGIVGDAEVADPPTERYLVRGRFWQEFLPEPARSKSVVLNAVRKSASVSRPADRRSILFLTAPYSTHRFWTTSDLRDILRVTCSAAADLQTELIIRVHPNEDIGFYRGQIAPMVSSDAASSITYSQGGSLDELLARSAVAITHGSTAFMECIQFGVPIVSYDWHDFSYKQRIRQTNAFNFAANLHDLRTLVIHGVEGTLPSFSGGIDQFAENTDGDALRRNLAIMIRADRPICGQRLAG